jgi:hypothetical protein
MKTLSPTDLNYVLRHVPRDVRELMKNHGHFLAGGFIRETIAGGKISDIDLLGPSKEVLRSSAAFLATARAVKAHFTDNAITIVAAPRAPVQFITRWLYNEAQPLVESFDFTVCQAVIWWENRGWASMTADDFYPDLAARRLVYTFPVREEDAGGSMMRVRKFLQRGYTIQADSLGGVIARLANKVRWSESHTERDVAKIITGLLREVDPLTIVDGVEPIDETNSLDLL